MEEKETAVDIKEALVNANEEVFSDPKFHDACTQTPKQRRRGGERGSRTRRKC